MTDPQTTSAATSKGAVLFDIDGTLIDSTYHHAVAWHRAFSRQGLQFPMWRIHRTIGMGGDKLVAEVAGEKVEAEDGDKLREAWKEEYAELSAEVEPFSGAGDLVRRVAGDGYVVALASSGEVQFAEEAIGDLGIADTMAVLTTNDDVKNSKPDADILTVTLRRLGGSGDDEVPRAVLVGDTPYDVESAAKIGLGCIAVLTGGFSQAELEEAGAVAVVADLTELDDFDWSRQLREPKLDDPPGGSSEHGGSEED